MTKPLTSTEYAVIDAYCRGREEIDDAIRAACSDPGEAEDRLSRLREWRAYLATLSRPGMAWYVDQLGVA